MPTSNPDTSAADGMNDTLNFMKHMWNGVRMPGVTMPSLSIEEIDKQIADLKTVENWLALNMNMLRATIQALEVQSGTLTALKSMSQSMGQSMESVEKAMGAAMDAAGSMAGFGAAAVDATGKSNASAGAGETAPATSAGAEPQADDLPSAESASATGADDATGVSGLAGAAAPFVNPAAWWGMLQDQFRQAVEQALAPNGKVAEPRAKSSAKRAASKPAGNHGQGKRRAGANATTARASQSGNASGSRSAKSAASRTPKAGEVGGRAGTGRKRG